MGTCVRDGCDRNDYRRSLCNSHYEEAKKTGDFPDASPRKCSKESCDGDYFARVDGAGPGYCKLHYKELRPSGSFADKPEHCSYQDCDRKPYGRVYSQGDWLCNAHHAQAKKGNGLASLKCAQRCGRDKNGKSRLCTQCRDDLVAQGLRYCNKHGVRPAKMFTDGGQCHECMKTYGQARRDELFPFTPCVMDGCDNRPVGGSELCHHCHADLRSRGQGRCTVHGIMDLSEFTQKRQCKRCAYPRHSKKMRETRKAYLASRLNEQEYKCAICSGGLTFKSAHIDHDHECECGKPSGCSLCRRSALCGRCNRTIGIFREDLVILHRLLTVGGGKLASEWITSAIRYVTHWHAVMVSRGVRKPDVAAMTTLWISELATEALGQSKLA